MSLIDFESAREKEKQRQELRDAREQMLKEAEARFHKREQRDREKVLKGESNFLLPSIEKKLKKNSKKSKKVKKEKKKKHKRKKSSSSDSDDSDDNHKSRKKRKKKRYSSPSSSNSDSSDSGSEDEWVEKKQPENAKESSEPLVRDSWMFDTTIATFSKEKKEPKKDERKHIDSYDPTKSVKELNPYWKDGGGGLPSSTFQKPKYDSDDDDDGKKNSYTSNKSNVQQRGNWRKKDIETQPVQQKETPKRQKTPSESSKSESESEEDTKEESSSMKNFLTDQQMNELGAKIVKAEIMGNDSLAKQLKEKLELARECRKNVKVPEKRSEKSRDNKNKKDVQEIILTKSSTHGTSRPLDSHQDPYGRQHGGKKKKQKPADTHVSGERVKYFPDDDKYDIKQMFEREKFTTSSDGDAQFTKIAMASSKAGSSRDNLEDIFASEAYKSMSDSKQSERERARAINEHQKTTKMLENCEMCIDSMKIEKQLIIALGNKVYLSLPWHEGLQPGHCLISTTAHLSCATSVDEEIWSEINDFRKALTRMFAARKQDVIFFETVRYLHKNPHMVIHCVPSKNFEMAPFYFKKAIQESEREWSMNKQLIDLRKEKKDLRRAIPRGLPYFWVNFGMDDGFAHVIEEQERFPYNFAQEVIGGILELDPRVFRKPRREHNPIPKVKQFAEWWKHYDCTTQD